MREDTRYERARAVLPGGAVSLYHVPGRPPVIIDRGAGSHVVDIEGNEYVDYLLGSGPMLLGHAHPAVTAAIRAQAERGTTFYTTTPAAVALAEEVVAAVPCAEQVRFTSSGSEATLQAIRYAKAATGRTKILKFAGAFHGGHDYALAESGPGEEAPAPAAAPRSAGLSPGLAAEVVVVPYNDLQACRRAAREHQRELAAILVEPLQRFVPPEPGFLPGLRAVAGETGAMLIFDEVVTGFRLAYGGAQERYGVRPDLACYGKVLGGGLPIGAVCGPKALLELCVKEEAPRGRWVYHGGTLSGNPLSAAAGLATLRELKRPGTYERLHHLGAWVRTGLDRLFREAGVDAAALGDGPLAGVVFGGSRPARAGGSDPADRARASRFLAGLLAEGVFVNPGGSKLYISAVHTDADIDALLRAARHALARG